MQAAFESDVACDGLESVLFRILSEDLRPEIPERVPSAYTHLIEACWEAEPAARPTAGKAVRLANFARRALTAALEREAGDRAAAAPPACGPSASAAGSARLSSGGWSSSAGGSGALGVSPAGSGQLRLSSGGRRASVGGGNGVHMRRRSSVQLLNEMLPGVRYLMRPPTRPDAIARPAGSRFVSLPNGRRDEDQMLSSSIHLLCFSSLHFGSTLSTRCARGARWPRRTSTQ